MDFQYSLSEQKEKIEIDECLNINIVNSMKISLFVADRNHIANKEFMIILSVANTQNLKT